MNTVYLYFDRARWNLLVLVSGRSKPRQRTAAVFESANKTARTEELGC